MVSTFTIIVAMGSRLSKIVMYIIHFINFALLHFFSVSILHFDDDNYSVLLVLLTNNINNL